MSSCLSRSCQANACSTSARALTAPVPLRSNLLARKQEHRYLAPVQASDPAQPSATEATDELLSETEMRRRAAEKLRKAEKFLVVGNGSGVCTNCNYEYKPENGDPDFPVPRGVRFEQLPADYFCPTCGAPMDKFRSNAKVVAGFAENQTYGLGANTWTGDQKLAIIYGSLALFFLLFLGGYALE